MDTYDEALYIYEKPIQHWGERLQILKTIEELEELRIELHKDLNGNRDITAITEELADVYNMLIQIQIIYKIDGNAVRNTMLDKMKRTLKRIGGQII